VLPSQGVEVNKRELAVCLGVSLPTVSAWIDRYPDFPIVERGTNGREWRFDVEAVRGFMRRREEEEERAETARAEQIRQVSLPTTDPGDIAGNDVLTLDQIRAIRATDELRRSRGFLVSVPELRQAMTAAIARWSAAELSVLQQAGRDLALPEPVVRALQDRFADARRQFVRSLAEATEPRPHERLIA